MKVAQTTRWILRIALPVVILAAGAGLAAFLVSLRPQPATLPPRDTAPLVETIEARAEDVTLTVHAYGTVVPRTQSRLVAEVSGRVVSVSPSLAPGGFFEAGQELLSIDDVDYRLALEEARGRIAAAQLRLTQEEADAEIARADWERLGLGEPDALALREPQLADARAQLAVARAAVAQAERDVERCSVRAPYAGRVLKESVDTGQFVARGEVLAELYAVDWAEVRLPLPDAELAFLDLPLDFRPEPGAAGELAGDGDAPPAAGPAVTLSARFAGRRHHWQGRIVRTEGEIDAQTRMVVAVARVEDPYRRRADADDQAPLAVGLFVEAEIEGARVPDAIALPRDVLRGSSRVFVLEGDDTLRFRTVQILKLDRDRVVLAGGLEPGERIIRTPIEAATDGMRVRLAEVGS